MFKFILFSPHFVPCWGTPFKYCYWFSTLWFSTAEKFNCNFGENINQRRNQKRKKFNFPYEFEILMKIKVGTKLKTLLCEYSKNQQLFYNFFFCEVGLKSLVFNTFAISTTPNAIPTTLCYFYNTLRHSYIQHPTPFLQPYAISTTPYAIPTYKTLRHSYILYNILRHSYIQHPTPFLQAVLSTYWLLTYK